MLLNFFFAKFEKRYKRLCLSLFLAFFCEIHFVQFIIWFFVSTKNEERSIQFAWNEMKKKKILINSYVQNNACTIFIFYFCRDLPSTIRPIALRSVIQSTPIFSSRDVSLTGLSLTSTIHQDLLWRVDTIEKLYFFKPCSDLPLLSY